MLRASTDLPTRGRRERNGKKRGFRLHRRTSSRKQGPNLRAEWVLVGEWTGDRLISDDLAADVEVDRCIDALKAELEALRAQAKAALLKS
jgi:hypothetical protein